MLEWHPYDRAFSTLQKMLQRITGVTMALRSDFTRFSMVILVLVLDDTVRGRIIPVVGHQWVGIGRVEGIFIAIRIGVEGICTLQELSSVRPPVIIGVEHVVLGIGRVEPIAKLPTVPAASSV